MNNQEWGNAVLAWAMLACGAGGALTMLWGWIRRKQLERAARVDESPNVLPRDTIAEARSKIKNGRLLSVGWLGILNLQPDNYPHTLIIGATGTGKTTFTRALLSARPGRVAVLTPKPDPNDWPGVPIVTIDDTGRFTELTEAFAALDTEVRARLVASKKGQPIDEPLTIVCDDWPVLARECGAAATDVFKTVGRLGRSLGMRLVVLSQSDRVMSLGIKGEGDAVENFARVVLARGHKATLELDELQLPLDTSAVPQLASEPAPMNHWWNIPIVVAATSGVLSVRTLPTGRQAATPDADRVLHGLLDMPAVATVATVATGIATERNAINVPVATLLPEPLLGSEVPESLPPDIAVLIASVDWATVAKIIEGGVSETLVLKSLGFPAGSTSIKYRAAKARLQAARELLKK
ncbi:MAG: type IV secretory system conjugative DNA transfer family protein [Roseiflexaceae bacterium]|nr:type IV secretory system conjugative DNA transfer family protein [Roseiflexaceae bacterium]